MLSTAFGYGRPAFSARALAAAFCPEDRGVDFFLGFFFSQTGLLATFVLLRNSGCFLLSVSLR